ncbi:MAG: hypothetical protein ACE5FQ_08380 [Thiogranum sp.]
MPSLYLHPADALWQPAEYDAMIDALCATGLIGRPGAQAGTDGFPAGDRFMQQIMFLGCSPQPVFDPSQAQDGSQPCCVHLRCYEEVRFLGTERCPAVRCAGCRTPARLPGPHSHDALYRCGQCGNESRFPDLDWRKGAGFGRFFIEISGVYPHEAVPSDALLNTLGTLSGCHWKYFYTQGWYPFNRP